MTALAHSARGTVPVQTYADHIGGVVQRACRYADKAARHTSRFSAAIWRGLGWRPSFMISVSWIRKTSGSCAKRVCERHCRFNIGIVVRLVFSAWISLLPWRSIRTTLDCPVSRLKQNRAKQAFRIGKSLRGRNTQHANIPTSTCRNTSKCIGARCRASPFPKCRSRRKRSVYRSISPDTFVLPRGCRSRRFSKARDGNRTAGWLVFGGRQAP